VGNRISLYSKFASEGGLVKPDTFLGFLMPGRGVIARRNANQPVVRGGAIVKWNMERLMPNVIICTSMGQAEAAVAQTGHGVLAKTVTARHIHCPPATATFQQKNRARF
jgi:hypothetical protein